MCTSVEYSTILRFIWSLIVRMVVVFGVANSAYLTCPRQLPLSHGRVEFSGIDHCLCCCSELSWRHSLDHPSRKSWTRHVSPIVLSVLELGLLIVFNFALYQCSVICHNASSWLDLDDVI